MPFIQPTSIFSILVALTVHECAHAFVAYRLGDPTARDQGRLTLNPVAHLDPLGALLFLFVGFGWAKPVPVNSSYFRHERRDTALVALAGPFSNLILAFLAFLGMAFLFPGASSSPYGVLSLIVTPEGGSAVQTLLLQICASSVFINLALMSFNLLPIAPLDGSRILMSLLPAHLEPEARRIMQHGPMVLIALLVAEAVLNFPIISLWVHTIVEAVLNVFFLVV